MYIYEQINKLKFDGNHSILRENCNKQRKTTRIVPDNFFKKKKHSFYDQLDNTNFFKKLFWCKELQL